MPKLCHISENATEICFLVAISDLSLEKRLRIVLILVTVQHFWRVCPGCGGSWCSKFANQLQSCGQTGWEERGAEAPRDCDGFRLSGRRDDACDRQEPELSKMHEAPRTEGSARQMLAEVNDTFVRIGNIFLSRLGEADLFPLVCGGSWPFMQQRAWRGPVRGGG